MKKRNPVQTPTSENEQLDIENSPCIQGIRALLAKHKRKKHVEDSNMDILRRNAELLHQSAPNPYAHQHSKPRLSYGPSPEAMMRRLARMQLQMEIHVP